jgi:MYXO-CTERM domain-containing protein
MRTIAKAAVLAATLCAARTAHAFCGFYVAGGDQQMFNDATQVVLMRSGTRTVLSMQNNYKGPPENFAMVVPVPVVLQEKDVKTLNREVFEHVEKMGAPRLVEYWEHDPCEPDYYDDDIARTSAKMPLSEGAADKKEDENLGVRIEAKFVVGEYQILILSAKDSTGLDTWLEREKYTVPADAEPLLRPYVEAGMKWFVAKVDTSKVKWVGEGNDKRAELSPLRFHYDSEELALPIRLGLANSAGTQDLIVNILAPNQRYETANYKNVTIPTNIDVDESMKEKFGAFYTALYDRTVEKNPGAVITEYAWQATTCDPCPGPALAPMEFQTLGADVLSGTRDKPTPYMNADFVLTRLHARYGKTVTDDLRFKAAPPIVGGREHVVANGKLEEGAQPSSTNNFQGRYAVRHRWSGAVKCDKPVFGRWGGPPGQRWAGPPQSGTNLAFAPRGQVELAKAVKQDVPEIDVKAVAATVASGGWGTPSGATKPEDPPKAPPPPANGKKGCGCNTGADPGWLLLGLALLLRRRRK